MDVTLTITTAGGAPVATITPLSAAMRRAVDEIGSAQYTIAGNAPGAGAIQIGHIVTAPGFEGIVEAIGPTYAADGTFTLALMAGERTRELAWTTAGPMLLAGGGESLNIALTRLLAGTGWTCSAGALAGVTVYAQADGASIWAMLRGLAQLVGARIIYTGLRTLQMVTAASTTVDAIVPARDLPAGQVALLGYAREQRGIDLLTEIFPFGGGNGAARLTLNAATDSLPAGYSQVIRDFGAQGAMRGVRHDAGYASVGARQRSVQFQQITPIYNTDADVIAASNALLAAAITYLARRAAPVQSYTLNVGSGATLIEPGQAVRVSLEGAPVVLPVLGVSTSWDSAGIASQTLSVSTDFLSEALEGAAATVRQLEDAAHYRTHAQLFANIQSIYAERRFSNSVDASFTFRIDEAVTQIRRLAIDFLLGPLESAVTGIALSVDTTPAGDHTHTIPAVADHTHSLSNVQSVAHAHTRPAHTHPLTGVPAHTHVWEAMERTSAATNGALFYNGAATPNITIVAAANGPTRQIPVLTSGTATATDNNAAPANTGSDGPRAVSGTMGAAGAVAAGTSGAGGAHDHAMTAQGGVGYGLWRDQATNVFALAEVEIQLNSSAWQSLSTGQDMGGGWRRLDFTADAVTTSTMRPKALSNTVRIRTSAAARVNADVWIAYGDFTIKRYNARFQQQASIALPVNQLCRWIEVANDGTLYVWMNNGIVYLRGPNDTSWTAVYNAGVGNTICGMSYSSESDLLWVRTVRSTGYFDHFSARKTSVTAGPSIAAGQTTVTHNWTEADPTGTLYYDRSTMYNIYPGGYTTAVVSASSVVNLVGATADRSVPYNTRRLEIGTTFIRDFKPPGGGSVTDVTPTIAPAYSHPTIGYIGHSFVQDGALWTWAGGARIVARDLSDFNLLYCDSGALSLTPSAFCAGRATDPRRARVECQVNLSTYIQAIVPA